MKCQTVVGVCRFLAAAIVFLSISACGGLRPNVTPFPVFYSLDGTPGFLPAGASGAFPAAGSTLIIDPPHAAAGFDSQRIVYVREAHKIEYFANSEWVDTPARMIAPLLVAAMAGTGGFRAVVLTPSASAGELRLATEIIRMQQEFGAGPSRVRFTLRAYLVDDKTRKVLAMRELEAAVPASSEDAKGGVEAANRAVQVVLGKLAAFGVETLRSTGAGK